MAGRSGQIRSAFSILVLSLQRLRFRQSSAAPIATPSAIQMGSLVNTKAQAPSAVPTPIQWPAMPEFSVFLLTALTTQPLLDVTQYFGGRLIVFLLSLFENAFLFQGLCKPFCSDKCNQPKNKAQNCESFHRCLQHNHYSNLFNRDAFSQVARLIDVRAPRHGHVIRQ